VLIILTSKGLLVGYYVGLEFVYTIIAVRIKVNSCV